jgi:hypothetical protein
MDASLGPAGVSALYALACGVIIVLGVLAVIVRYTARCIRRLVVSRWGRGIGQTWAFLLVVLVALLSGLLSGCGTRGALLVHPQTSQQTCCHSAECIARFQGHGYVVTSAKSGSCNLE